MATLDDSTLVAFVDGELDPALVPEVERAIAEDPAAQEKVRRLRRSAVLVRAVFRDPVYDDMAGRLGESLYRLRAPHKVAPSHLHFGRSMALALACAVIGFGGGFTLARYWPAEPDFSERLLDEIADYHTAYADEDEYQVEVPAERPGHIENWLSERLHHPLSVPDLAHEGLTFKGARLLVIDGHPVAELMYGWSALDYNLLGLCISYTGPGSDTSSLKTDHRDGVNQVLWHRGDYAYVLVGWADMSFLTRLATRLNSELTRG